MAFVRPLFRLVPLLLIGLLVACGNKGDLVKPTPKPGTPPVSAPASESQPAATTQGNVPAPAAPEADKH
jgi:hypothetical protein